MRSKVSVIPWRVSLYYVLIAGCYIVLSDHVLSLIFSDPLVLTRMQTYKGWAFIITTAVLLFVVLSNQLRQILLEVETRRRAEEELQLAYEATIEGWARALDLRDKETHGHCCRVTEMTVALARSLAFEESAMVHIRRGAALHDVGKMGIPDSILLKPADLTPAEWQVMRRHPELAHEMLSSIEYLRPALAIPYSHHEKWDGTGYPLGLCGESIPLEARIFAVVDVYDALTSDRPYRRAWSQAQALDYIAEQSGKHFDPQVVELFLKTGPT